MKRITKKAHAVRGQEIKWEIPVYMSIVQASNKRLVLMAVGVVLAFGLAGTARGQLRAMTVTNGLISWWQAESNATDSVSGHNGTIGDHTSFASGQVGGAFSFDGQGNDAGSGIDLGNVADFDFGATNGFSISAWFDCFGPTDPSNDGQIIVSLNYNCTPTVENLGISQNANLAFEIRDANGVQAVVSLPAPVSLHHFHHAVGVREVNGNDKTVRLYLDGVLVDSAPDPTTATLAGPYDDVIGRRNWCGSYDPFYGLIDEVMIYNRALSSDEVQKIYVAQGGQFSLTVTYTGTSVVVSWPSPSTGFVLQQNSDLATTSWSTNGLVISDDGTNRSSVISPPQGHLFFRLKQ